MIASADPSAVIAGLPRSASGRVQAEFSVKISPAGLARFGRFAAWVDADDAAAIAAWLRRIGAPDAVIAAHADAPRPLRQGAAVSIGGGREIEYRLYLHGQSADTQADDYVGLRWIAGDDQVRRSRYTFHFAPETPDGARPETLVPAWARDGVAAITDEPIMRRLSGFWLRRDEAGRLDQIDLATTWMPPVAALAGARQLLDALGLDGEDRRWVEALPVRHVALPAEGAPSLTLYCAASLPDLPADEPALQAAVIAAAGETARDIAAFVATLPPQPDAPPQRGAIDHFYSGEIALWQAALGPHMHYHHGLFDAPDAPSDDAAMLAASRRAVSALYPFIAEGASVYDIGCGWGGPLDMLARERGCRALGVTIARNQFAHVASLGLPVRWADAERTLPPRWFDCMLLLESFEHMQDKPALLRLLTEFTGRLVMRVNCQDQAPASTNFGGSMPMVSSATLRAILEETGWRISHWRDRRAEAMPSAAAWARRLAAIPPTQDHHLETFRHWAPRVEALGTAWGRNNPLIECVAER